MLTLTGLGGNENIPRPYRNREFYRLERTVLLIAAMTCVENGIRMEQVDMQAIWDGYDLAYPGKRKDDRPSEDLTAYDEYWDWSPQAYKPA
ncbi:MAG: hypothetical protein IJD32_04150 [Bacteroidaceae bacterium]|nr:hypothetical protein [Bacteroidaceae bacterium]